MSYCLSTSDFLEEFFPVPEDIKALQEAARLPKCDEKLPKCDEKLPKCEKKLPKGANACKPKGINFNYVKGFTSERDLAERWVSGSVVIWSSLPLHTY